MSNLNQCEFNSIREVVGSHITTAMKLGEYAAKCNDPQIKQMFTQGAQDARKSANQLTNML